MMTHPTNLTQFFPASEEVRTERAGGAEKNPVLFHINFTSDLKNSSLIELL